VRFLGLKAGSRVLIEDSLIGPYSEFDNSKLKFFRVKNGVIKNSKMNDATVDEILIENTKMDFPIANGILSNVTFRNVNFIELGESRINSLTIEDCKENTDILLAETIFKSISIRNCPADTLLFGEAKGDKIRISDMTIKDAIFKKLIVK
jgi:hypothetical protein